VLVPTSILTTKLYIPQARPNLVLRQRLIKRLNQGLKRALTLICAPAGFGKTTLLNEWHTALSSGQAPAVAWVSLDAGDNDPVRLFAYLIAALQTVESRLGERAQAMLQSPQTPPLESILTALINDVATISNTLMCVFDDYDVIRAQTIHDAMTFMLDHLPPQMHLVITSRADPPLPLARLRARGQLTEIRAADLRFTLDEAALLLNQVLGLSLSTQEVAALEDRTEGWVAGLQLAALSMQGQTDIPSFIKAFTGEDRFILDYLVSEVLQRQPEPIRTFLLHTSILDRLSGSLCNAVTGQSTGQETLEGLEQANLFIFSLDSQRRWYRYHHLFADSLRHRLEQVHPEIAPTLHCRASLWYEQQGFVDEAIHHALAADDAERAACLIEQNGIAAIARGQARTVLRWLSALPDELVRARTQLCITQAAALTFTYQLEAAEARLLDAEQSIQMNLQEDQARAVLGQVAVMRAALARIPGDLTRCVAYAHQALELLPEADTLWRGPAAVYAGLATA
jgi:LuxR family maltose regulon positive regulatory protein